MSEMWTKTVIYEAPEHDLPAPLPSLEEIFNAPVTVFQHDPSVVRIGEHFVVKYGPKVTLHESQCMLYIKQHTNVPIPTLYASWSLEDDQHKWMTMLIMEYVPGDSLDDAVISHEEKAVVELLVREHLRELRSLPQPTDTVARWFGTVTKFWPWKLPKNFDELEGPYHSESEFVDQNLAAQLRVRAACLPKDPDVAEREKSIIQQFKNVCGEGPAVFSHGDLFPHNIILKPNGTGWDYWEDKYPELENLRDELLKIRQECGELPKLEEANSAECHSM
ncbi:hypothetical protein F5Y16DRAFT_418811 [Xylariaceae sp. FL0255]|nr:hypothetical protein F5Y16DRAFT_418811 [Xylariaceae sp. FL0255]